MNGYLEIEKGVPIPKLNLWQSDQKTNLYPIALAMEVGDSVLFDNRIQAASFASALRRMKRKATMRQVGKHNDTRVWRIA